MFFTELTIYTKEEDLEILASGLEDIGIDSISISNPTEMLEYVESNEDGWDMVDQDLLEQIKNERPNITVYVDESDTGLIKKISDLLDKMKAEGAISSDIEVTTSSTSEDEWAYNWKDVFKITNVGETLAVVPVWEKDTDVSPRTKIIIDPGTSFGSGMHETTQMCMEALEDYLIENDTVLDAGCGSGILSVTAAKLGASKVYGVDIEEDAVRDTKETAILNGEDDKIEAILKDITTGFDNKVDVIVGNLFANTIKMLMPYTSKILDNEGLFITSGIIAESVEDVKESYTSNGYQIVEVLNKNEWFCIVGQKVQE